MKKNSGKALEQEVLSNLANMQQIDRYYQKALQDLEKSNDKFSRIFTFSNDAIFILDPEKNTINNANPKAHKMLSYATDRLKGKKFETIQPLGSPDFFADSQKYLDSDKGWTQQIDFLTQDDKIIPAEISASTIKDDEQLLILAIVRDISLRVKWEEEREKLIKNLNDKNRQLERMVHLDSMTQLYNHQYILHLLDKEILRAKRYELPLTIIMLDLDHFKDLNDKHGHQIGDDILIQSANAFNRLCREVDIIGRYGGEEFLLILPNTSVEEGLTLGERIRDHIEHLPWKHKDIKLTISGGLAFWKGQNATEFIKLADDRLYKAKESGRNQICS